MFFKLKYEIVERRNARMAARIGDLLTTQPRRSFFIALGAGHFHGARSVIAALQRLGYFVEALDNSPRTR